MGCAHANPDGYHHGGLTEEEQGKGIVSNDEGYTPGRLCGGLIFEWMDEWAKKTWITEPFMIPYERHVLWHNTMGPEQNYGLCTVESADYTGEEHIQEADGVIKKISLGCDSTFLYLNFELARSRDFNRERLLIGLDTYDRARGEFRFAPDLETAVPGGMEFLI